ncbi:LPXTG cell wall anchor domain-containing protein [Enterococcus mundtii]|uniref:LPXTG cell wall anchor domain-containing protein n=1 Tax=Enterococcus mundtii TaxID=53346 RepID=A0A848N0S9_ENTMU|nr:LPXTG cell wall anchor domain-containing protein [Enterococcus mundtii]NMP59539.1 LPXTG cell wall anchor domain-containing protein [Enterococcus mundtii]
MQVKKWVTTFIAICGISTVIAMSNIPVNAEENQNQANTDVTIYFKRVISPGKLPGQVVLPNTNVVQGENSSAKPQGHLPKTGMIRNHWSLGGVLIICMSLILLILRRKHEEEET